MAATGGKRTANGIQLVYEDDARGVLLGGHEQLTDAPRPHTHKQLRMQWGYCTEMRVPKHKTCVMYKSPLRDNP